MTTLDTEENDSIDKNILKSIEEILERNRKLEENKINCL